LRRTNKERTLNHEMAVSSQEVGMGDKSPKSKQRDKKQKEAAKVRSDEKKAKRQQPESPAAQNTRK